MGITTSIAKWLMNFGYDDFIQEVIRNAKKCVLDTLGCALAGAKATTTEIVKEFVLQESCIPRSLVWGTRFRTSPDLAALVNGTMAHALDYDETNYSSIAHPSSVLIPATLALAELRGCSGKDFLTSFILGHEIMCKLGAAVNPKAYHKGWWTTSVLGVIGAGAAAARLLGLGREQVEWTLGIAASQSAGIRGNNGTLAKPFQAGRAAQSGVISAQLAKGGLVASCGIFEKSGGFLEVYAGGDHKIETIALGEPFDLINPGTAFKQYPSCSATHSAVDAVIEIACAQDLPCENISSITCEVTPLAEMSLPYNVPLTPDEARFSMPFCVAAALKERELSPSCFSEVFLKDPKIVELMKKVSIKLTADLSVGEQGFSMDAPEAARVTIRTKDNANFSKTVKNAKGGPQKPLTTKEIKRKFRSCVENVLLQVSINRIQEMVFELEAIGNIGDLVELLKGAENSQC